MSRPGNPETKSSQQKAFQRLISLERAQYLREGLQESLGRLDATSEKLRSLEWRTSAVAHFKESIEKWIGKKHGFVQSTRADQIRNTVSLFLAMDKMLLDVASGNRDSFHLELMNYTKNCYVDLKKVSPENLQSHIEKSISEIANLQKTQIELNEWVSKFTQLKPGRFVLFNEQLEVAKQAVKGIYNDPDVASPNKLQVLKEAYDPILQEAELQSRLSDENPMLNKERLKAYERDMKNSFPELKRAVVSPERAKIQSDFLVLDKLGMSLYKIRDEYKKNNQAMRDIDEIIYNIYRHYNAGHDTDWIGQSTFRQLHTIMDKKMQDHNSWVNQVARTLKGSEKLEPDLNPLIRKAMEGFEEFEAKPQTIRPLLLR